MADKLTHVAVDYRPTADYSRSCGNCVMFEAPGDCSLVRSPIWADAVCNRFVRKRPSGGILADADG